MTLENKILKDKISVIINHFNIKEFNKVIDESNRLLKKYPNVDTLWNLLGLTYQKVANYDKAEKTLFRALQVNPNNISALNNLGNNYKYLGNFVSAEEYFKKALNLNSNYIGALVNLGNLKFELNKPKDALTFLNKAFELNNKELIIHLNLSLIYQSLGEFSNSIFHLKKINELFPSFTRADKMLSALTNYKDEKQHLTLMQNKLKNLKLDLNQKIQIYFAISKAYEDNNNFLKAHEYFEKGNKLKREQSKYSIKKDKTLFENIKKLFNNIDIKKFKVTTSSKNIIFIVGMPRSGTTLVEQIISSHNDIYGAGELSYLNKIIYKEFFNEENTDFTTNINDMKDFNFDKISKNYHDCLKNFDFNENYITDKALLNFQWIGFIKILFPNAKIINCVRNPKDNCLSIYKNLFEHEGPWCYDKLELIAFYNLYSDLMKFWETKFPNTIYNIQYENLVKNPNIQIKELINSIGVKWDDQCLKFYDNKNIIKTLSVNQARKKIYTTSLSFYDKYKPHLVEFSKYFDKD